MIARLLPFRSASSDRFNAQSDVAGYTLKIADPQYIEYVAAKNNLFSSNAIVDPAVQMNRAAKAKNHTVKNIRINMVSDLPQPMFLEVGKRTDANTRPSPWGKGAYHIEGDTLVFDIYLDIPQIMSGTFVPKYAVEEKLIELISKLILLAVHPGDPQYRADMISQTQASIKDNLLSGLFQWPLRIESK